jgi:hypothetical protein
VGRVAAESARTWAAGFLEDGPTGAISMDIAITPVTDEASEPTRPVRLFAREAESSYGCSWAIGRFERILGTPCPLGTADFTRSVYDECADVTG